MLDFQKRQDRYQLISSKVDRCLRRRLTLQLRLYNKLEISNSLKTLLNRPFPPVKEPIHKWALISFFSVFTFLFLLIFQPFGGHLIEQKTLVFLGFGFVVFLGLVIGYWVLPITLKSWFNYDAWTIGKEILFLSFNTLVIAVLNFLYNAYLIPASFSPIYHSLLEFVGITFSVGFFPIVILVLVVERFLNTKNIELANQQTNAKQKEQTGSILSSLSAAQFSIKPDTIKAAPLQLTTENFLYANADGNYTSFYYLNPKGELKSELLRISLKQVVNQTAGISEVKQCHKSYIVNTSKILRFEGNARSLSVVLEGTQTEIPVSKSYIEELNKI